MNEKIVQTDNTLLDRANCALVIVDIQEKLAPVITGAEETIRNVIKLVKFSKIIGIPIVVTEQQNLGKTVEPIRSEIGEAEPISKMSFSCFGSEEFENYLHFLGKKALILTGIESHICVVQTALDAPHEYKIQVVSDAVASRSLRNRDIALQRMGSAGITVTSTEMLIYELLKKAGTHEFRATLPLVK